MVEKIQLLSAEFKAWMEAEEQGLTRAKDKLALLESQERRLSGIWESGARNQWEAGFQREFAEVGRWIIEAEKLLRQTQERAEELLQIEKGLIGEVQRL